MPKARGRELAKMFNGLRDKLALMQEWFAATVGVMWSTVSRWENCRGSQSPLAMRRIEELIQGHRDSHKLKP